MTAREIVDEVREKVQGIGKGPYIDGFSTDPPQRQGTNILKQVNMAYRELLVDTEFLKCTFTKTLADGTEGFTLDDDIASIESMTLTDATSERIYTLSPTGIPRLNHTSSDWRNRATGRPTNYYLRGSNYLGIVPTSDDAHVVKIVATAMLTNLSGESDTPSTSGLPELYHDALVVGASYYLSLMDSANEAARIRGVQYLREWNSWKKRVKKLVEGRTINDQQGMVLMRDDYRALGRRGRR